MAHSRRLLHDRHNIIIVCFHGKRKIVPAHIHLTHKIREKHSLRSRIITIQLGIAFPQVLHRIDGFPCHIHRIPLAVHTSGIYHGTAVIPLYLHTQCIAMGHDIVINPEQLLRPLLQRHILLPLFLSEILLRKGRTMIDHRTIQSHDCKHE